MLNKAIYLYAYLHGDKCECIKKKKPWREPIKPPDRSVMGERMKPNFYSMEHRHLFMYYLYN